MSVISDGISLAQVYLQTPNLWPAVAGGGGLILVIVVLLYPGQLRGTPWVLRVLLPLLRCLALLAILAALLKPVALRLASARERGTIAIAVDASRSMSIVDNSRSDTERVALADSLGLLQPGARAGAAPGLGADLDRLSTLAANVRAAEDDLEFALISGREVEDRRDKLTKAVAAYRIAAEAVASRASEANADAPLHAALIDLLHIPDARALDAWRRTVPRQLDHAREELVHFHANFDQHLYDTDPATHEACGAVAKLSRFELTRDALLAPQSGLLARLGPTAPVAGFLLGDSVKPQSLWEQDQPVANFSAEPDGLETDLVGGIASALSGMHARALVLFSDGRQVGAASRTAGSLLPTGVPVFAVSTAAAVPPRDLSFGKVVVPSGAFIGDIASIHAEIRHEGIEKGTAEVHLKAEGLAEQVKSVELRAGQSAVDFQLEVKRDQAGLLPIEIAISPIAGEATTRNNVVHRWLKVMPERLRVAVWSGAAGWDYQEICRLLSSRGEIELSRGIFDGASNGLQMSVEQILRQDVILLLDVPLAALSVGQWDAVSRLVSERGGSVILVAGVSHLPAEYGANIAASSLLPFSPALKPRFRVWPGEQPAFRFVPDADAVSMEPLRLSSDPGLAYRPWQELPPVYRFLQLPNLREGKLRPGARAMLVEADSRAPILLERRQGAGRSFFFCSDETWRWRLNKGETYQGRFWRQLIHYAAQEPYFASDGVLSVDAEVAASTPEAPVRVRARMLDAAGLSSASCELAILRDGVPFGTRTLTAAGESGSGRFEGLVSLPAGDYLLRLHSGSSTVETMLKIVANDEAEMADLAGDEAFLRQLAQVSGGEYLRLDQIGVLPKRLADITDTRSMYVDIRLWDSPYLYLLVVGALAAEWALRKQWGLP